MNNKKLKEINELLESLGLVEIIARLLGSYESWKYMIENGFNDSEEHVWMLMHDCMRFKWSECKSYEITLDDHKLKLMDLLCGNKELIKSEIVLSCFMMSRKT